MDVVERLDLLLKNLKNEPYSFPDWSRCTAGHIYYVAEGNYGSEMAVRGFRRKLRHTYSTLSKAVIEAWEREPEYRATLSDGMSAGERRACGDLPGAVSDLTRAVSAARGDLPSVEAAIIIAEKALEYHCEKQRQAMLDVAAQAQEFCVPTTHATADDAYEAFAEHVTREGVEA